MTLRLITLIFAALQIAATAAAALPQTPAPASAPPASSDATIPEKGAAQNASLPPGYHIGAGDVLQIVVWREPEASVQSIVVRPDGIITIPLLKEINVLGLTPVELQKVLTDKLQQFIHGADVTVVVREIHSKKVYLVGAVNKVGPVPLLSNMTVLQVLAEAGGLTEYAKRKKIYIMRQQNGKQSKLPFDYDAVIKGEHMDQNIAVLPDDTIVVPH
jgi:polysaccharide export outer membrane protein